MGVEWRSNGDAGFEHDFLRLFDPPAMVAGIWDGDGVALVGIFGIEGGAGGGGEGGCADAGGLVVCAEWGERGGMDADWEREGLPVVGIAVGVVWIEG